MNAHCALCPDWLSITLFRLCPVQNVFSLAHLHVCTFSPQQNVDETFGIDKSTCRGAKKAEKDAVAENVKRLDMLKEGRSYVAVGRHYRINYSSFCSINREENNIRLIGKRHLHHDLR